MKLFKIVKKKLHGTIYLEMHLDGDVLDCFFAFLFCFLREGGGDVLILELQ